MELNGYNTSVGYMGFVKGEYVLFSSESDYKECMEDEEKENDSKRKTA